MSIDEIPEGLGYTEEEMYNEAYESVRAWDDHQRLEAISHLFKKKSIDDELGDYKLPARWFYWLKCFICLCLNRTNGSYLRGTCIVTWDYGGYGEYGSSWMACWVETGIFKGWKVCISSDGD